MASGIKIHKFIEDLAHGVHNFDSDTFKFALVAAANAPDPAEDSVLADLTTVALTNLQGTDEITVTSATQTSGILRIVLEDKTIEADGGDIGPFRYIVIYNDTTAADSLVCVYDIGIDVEIEDGQNRILDFNETSGAIVVS